MDEKALEGIGLSKSEARTYLTLLKIGSCKAGKIAKETGYNRTTIYKTLESLGKRGLVGYVVKENRRYYECSNPENLFQDIEKKEENLKKRKKKVKEMLPQLQGLFETRGEELEVIVFRGKRGLKTVFEDMLRELKEGDEYLAFGVPKHAQIFSAYFDYFNKMLVKKKIKHRIIFDERENRNIKSCKKCGFQVKVIGKEFLSPAEINIYKNNVIIALWHPKTLAIVIKNKEINESFKQYFNIMWKMAKKVNL